MSQTKAKTVARGYGPEHKRLRKRWAREVEAGVAHCARCGGFIYPGSLWDLDHTPDRTGYLGPSHVRCNRATAKHRTRRKRKLVYAFVDTRRVSRQW